jgi:hypothetical protein
MQAQLRTAVYFLAGILCFYAILITAFGFAISRLNNARDEELKAITLRQDLIRRVPKKTLPRIFVLIGSQKYQQESAD